MISRNTFLYPGFLMPFFMETTLKRPAKLSFYLVDL